MKKKKSRPKEYRAVGSGPCKAYLVRLPGGREARVEARTKYEAATQAARIWGVRWTSLARECEFIELGEDGQREAAP